MTYPIRDSRLHRRLAGAIIVTAMVLALGVQACQPITPAPGDAPRDAATSSVAESPTVALVATATAEPSVVPTPTPVDTDTPTPEPTETPLPTDTLLPTDTPWPTDTPLPTNTPGPPTDTPIPTDTPLPTDTPMPTATPTPEIAWRVIVARQLTPCENRGGHTLFIRLVDAYGNGLSGVPVMVNWDGGNMIVVTEDKERGPGSFDFPMYGGYTVTVVDGNSSETSPVLSSHLPESQRCDETNDDVANSFGHYSGEVIFQRAW